MIIPINCLINSRTSSEWIQVSNNVKPGQNFILLDLDPAVWYHLRVTAHNNAGFSVAEYEFATLTVTGGKHLYIMWILLFVMDFCLFSFLFFF